VNRTRALLLVTAIPLLIVLGVLSAATVGGGDDGAPPPRGTATGTTGERAPSARADGGRAPSAGAARAARSFVAGAKRTDVGSGPRGAAIFRPREVRRDPPVVVFLHGWLAVDPRLYGSWIAHLVHGGATVIYPTYQEAPFLDTVTPLPNTLVALRLALEQVSVAPGRLVVAGHSAGGALAADYAASARSAGLPAPAAVFSVYPGRSLRGISLRTPTVRARRIAAGTRVLALAGADDHVVGSRVARTIVRTATRARATLRIVRDPRVDDHGAPGRSDPAARRAFWAPLDRLIASTR
jgi:acetyl esterase/lipase